MTKKKQAPGRKAPSLLEWLSGAAGLVIAAGIIGFIGNDALADGPEKPPLLQVRPTGINSDGGLHMVEVTVDNRSSRTAADVTISGDLAAGGRTVETSSATLSYVPGKSQRKVGLIFRNDPRHLALTVRPGGYELP